MTAKIMTRGSGLQGRMILTGSDCGGKDTLVSLNQEKRIIQILMRKVMKPENNKDMWIPKYVLWAGIGSAVFGIFQLLVYLLAGRGEDSTGNLVLSIPFLLAALYLIACWKNQYIVMIDQNTFQYSTIFGRKKEYRFADICRVKKSLDSWTLLIKGPNGSGQVRIESCAEFSPRLHDRLLRACKAAGCVDKDLFD